jgi:hypothetical protein
MYGPFSFVPYNREQRKKAHTVENKEKRPIESRTKEKSPYSREQRKKAHIVDYI